jgi:DNA primase
MKAIEFQEIVELVRQLHDDHDPSLSVNAAGQYFHCFGCGIGGDGN